MGTLNITPMFVYPAMFLLQPALVQDSGASLKWAAAQVRRAEGPPPLRDDGAMGWIAKDAKDAVESIIAKYGRTPESLRLLARVNLCEGRYGDACAAFQAAGDATKAEEAKKLDMMARQFSDRNPNRHVLHIKPLNGAYAILHAIQVGDSMGGLGQSAWRDVKLAVTGRQGATLGPLKRPDFEFSEVNEAQLYAIDMDGDGTKEAVVMGVFYGASWTPTFTTVIGRTKAGWAISKVVDGHDPMWIQDLGKDGKWEFGGVNAIGMTLSHAEQPRWLEIYRYHRGTVHNVESQFPVLYNPYAKEIDALLKDHPDDVALLAYRGRVSRILNNGSQARAYERRALKHQPKSGVTPSWIRGIIWKN